MKGYFDYNATTPLHSVAREAWLEASERYWHNPSSLYQQAAAVKHLMEDARERLGEILGVDPERIVFTSGATESNNAIVQHFASSLPSNALALTSGMEHPSLAEPLETHFRGRLRKIATLPDTMPDLEDLNVQLQRPGVGFVSFMAANNESGTLLPWQEIARECKKRGVPFHCDASQWIGKMPSAALGQCDYLTGSAHKFGGPKGSGFLVMREEDEPLGLLLGGPQEAGRRAGTENYPAIAAMVSALEAAQDTLEAISKTQAALRDSFEDTVCRALPGTLVIGKNAPRLWNTSLLVLPAHDHRKWLARLSQAGFAISTGSACSAGDKGASSVMKAVNAPTEEWRRVLRFSGGWTTAYGEWESLAGALIAVAAGLDGGMASSNSVAAV